MRTHEVQNRRVNRASLRVFLSLLSFLALSAARGDAAGPIGPMSELVATGVRIAPVREGLAFAIAVSREGVVLTRGRFELRVPGLETSQQGASRLILVLEELGVEEGHLSGVARFVNRTEVDLDGLRVDLTERASLASPLYLGALAAGQESARVPFTSGPISLDPATPQTIVMGVVTGLAWLGEVKEPNYTSLAPGCASNLSAGGEPPRLGSIAGSSWCRATLGGLVVVDNGTRGRPGRASVLDSEKRLLFTFGEGRLEAASELVPEPAGSHLVLRGREQPALRIHVFSVPSRTELPR